ncbi:hypothetical protein M8J75_014139 [Diaphorina citri]|nr:hypothetical protein M8J75_014139 [Diaphorina citri]
METEELPESSKSKITRKRQSGPDSEWITKALEEVGSGKRRSKKVLNPDFVDTDAAIESTEQVATESTLPQATTSSSQDSQDPEKDVEPQLDFDNMTNYEKFKKYKNEYKEYRLEKIRKKEVVNFEDLDVKKMTNYEKFYKYKEEYKMYRQQLASANTSKSNPPASTKENESNADSKDETEPTTVPIQSDESPSAETVNAPNEGPPDSEKPADQMTDTFKQKLSQPSRGRGRGRGRPRLERSLPVRQSPRCRKSQGKESECPEDMEIDEDKEPKVPSPVSQLDKDKYCWFCHKEVVPHKTSNADDKRCKTCCKVFHVRCATEQFMRSEGVHEKADWECKPCIHYRELKDNDLWAPYVEYLGYDKYIKQVRYIIDKLKKYPSAQEFLHPVDTTLFPDYSQYIAHPVCFDMIERRLNEGAYRSVDTLYEDVKWMVHNSVIFNGGTSAITKDLRYLLKNLRMELYDLDSCACCYIHAYTRPELWFILPCPSPHLLVWAQLKGFPYWPAKVYDSHLEQRPGEILVKFFGDHARSWIPYENIYLYSLDPPSVCPSKKKKKGDMIPSLVEMDRHVQMLKKQFSVFKYPEQDILIGTTPEERALQLKYMLPCCTTTLPKKPSALTPHGSRHSDPDTPEPTPTKPASAMDLTDAGCKRNMLSMLEERLQQARSDSEDSVKSFRTIKDKFVRRSNAQRSMRCQLFFKTLDRNLRRVNKRQERMKKKKLKMKMESIQNERNEVSCGKLKKGIETIQNENEGSCGKLKEGIETIQNENEGSCGKLKEGIETIQNENEGSSGKLKTGIETIQNENEGSSGKLKKGVETIQNENIGSSGKLKKGIETIQNENEGSSGKFKKGTKKIQNEMKKIEYIQNERNIGDSSKKRPVKPRKRKAKSSCDNTLATYGTVPENNVDMNKLGDSSVDFVCVINQRKRRTRKIKDSKENEKLNDKLTKESGKVDKDAANITSDLEKVGTDGIVTETKDKSNDLKVSPTKKPSCDDIDQFIENILASTQETSEWDETNKIPPILGKRDHKTLPSVEQKDTEVYRENKEVEKAPGQVKADAEVKQVSDVEDSSNQVKESGSIEDTDRKVSTQDIKDTEIDKEKGDKHEKIVEENEEIIKPIQRQQEEKNQKEERVKPIQRQKHGKSATSLKLRKRLFLHQKYSSQLFELRKHSRDISVGEYLAWRNSRKTPEKKESRMPDVSKYVDVSKVKIVIPSIVLTSLSVPLIRQKKRMIKLVKNNKGASASSKLATQSSSVDSGFVPIEDTMRISTTTQSDDYNNPISDLMESSSDTIILSDLDRSDSSDFESIRRDSNDFELNRRDSSDLGSKRRDSNDLRHKRRDSNDLGIHRRSSSNLGYKRYDSNDLGHKRRNSSNLGPNRRGSTSSASKSSSNGIADTVDRVARGSLAANISYEELKAKIHARNNRLSCNRKSKPNKESRQPSADLMEDSLDDDDVDILGNGSKSSKTGSTKPTEDFFGDRNVPSEFKYKYRPRSQKEDLDELVKNTGTISKDSKTMTVSIEHMKRLTQMIVGLKNRNQICVDTQYNAAVQSAELVLYSEYAATCSIRDITEEDYDEVFEDSD